MSERAIHFVSGLPRSGSTLLCNILAQNPSIHSTPTSGCHEALFAMRNQWDKWIEHQAAPSVGNHDNLQRVLRAMLYSYHETDRPVVIDKGRGWTSLLEMTEPLLGRQAKVLVPVRSIAQILASLEKLWRKASATGQVPMDYFQSQTIEGRVKHWLEGSQVLGLAYNRLKDAMQRGWGDRLHLVEFDALTHEPESTMRGVYEFLGLPVYPHDFANIQQYTHETDAVHGGMGDHVVRSTVRPVSDDSVKVLGSALVRQFVGAEFWR